MKKPVLTIIIIIFGLFSGDSYSKDQVSIDKQKDLAIAFDRYVEYLKKRIELHWRPTKDGGVIVDLTIGRNGIVNSFEFREDLIQSEIAFKNPIKLAITSASPYKMLPLDKDKASFVIVFHSDNRGKSKSVKIDNPFSSPYMPIVDSRKRKSSNSDSKDLDKHYSSPVRPDSSDKKNKSFEIAGKDLAMQNYLTALIFLGSGKRDKAKILLEASSKLGCKKAEKLLNIEFGSFE